MEGTVFTPALQEIEHVKSDQGEILSKPFLDACKHILPVIVVKCRFDVVGRSFFSPSLGKPGTLGSRTKYWRGYYQSLRPTQMGLSLNIGIS
ncbi:hypothetical protein AAZV13_16G095200 [Glycine max]